ncbi:hypothetical protein NMG60_11035454 [Bertholletia excelsa]
MGVLAKLVDSTLFFFFTVIAVAAPLIDAPTCLPAGIFPDVLLDLNRWYSREYGDYLLVEKPHFFVGLVWLELLFQWPLAIANLYAILTGKSWFRTTCLVYGVSNFTSMIAILAEMMGSGKASEKLLMMYCPFLGFGLLATLRGLFVHSGKSSPVARRTVLTRKKRA